jgi:hypothetical protein
MGKTCQAVAKSTGQRCQKRSIPTSRYCLFHIDKSSLILSAIAGALAGLLLTEAYRHFVPSAETLELRTVREKAEQLHRQVDVYQKTLEGEHAASAAQERQHTEELTVLNKRLEPFVAAALAKYPGAGVDEALGKLRAETAEIRTMAEPPVISYGSHQVQRIPGGLTVLIWFKRSKDAFIGTINSSVTISPSQTTRLKAIAAAGLSMNPLPSLSADGTSGSVRFSPVGNSDPAIEVTLSGPARLRVVANQGMEPVFLDVQ